MLPLRGVLHHLLTPSSSHPSIRLLRTQVHGPGTSPSVLKRKAKAMHPPGSLPGSIRQGVAKPMGVEVGDTIVVTKGKDKGKIGQIVKVDNVRQEVLCEGGINLMPWMKRARQAVPGQPKPEPATVNYPCPVPRSMVALVDPSSGNLPTKIATRYTHTGKPVRIYTLSGNLVVPRKKSPARTTRNPPILPNDTPPDLVRQVTFDPAVEMVVTKTRRRVLM